MAINTEILSALTPDDIQVATSYLEDVFVHQHLQQDPSAECLAIIARLIQSCSNPSLKKQLFLPLNPPDMTTCFLALPFAEQRLLLAIIENLRVLHLLHNQLDKAQQQDVLLHYYNHTPAAFIRLRQALNPRLAMQEGIVIEKSRISANQCELYAQRIIELMQGPQASLQEAGRYLHSLTDVLDIRDNEKLTEFIFRQFQQLNIRVDSKENFSVYLTFFELAIQRVVTHPIHTPLLHGILTPFLYQLTAIQSPHWILKLLDQLPLFILKKCIGLLSEHETIRDPKKRHAFLRLYQLIQKNNNAEYTTLKEAYES